MYYEYFKIETFIPKNYVDRLRESLNDVGALNIGQNYDNCMSVSKVTGYWRPINCADPFQGAINKLSSEEECKVEFRCRSKIVYKIMNIIKQVHPYEEPVINIIPLVKAN